MMQWHILQVKSLQDCSELILYVCMSHLKLATNAQTHLVEEQDEIESEGDEQGQEPKVVEVAREVVLGVGGIKQ